MNHPTIFAAFEIGINCSLCFFITEQVELCNGLYPAALAASIMITNLIFNKIFNLAYGKYGSRFGLYESYNENLDVNWTSLENRAFTLLTSVIGCAIVCIIYEISLRKLLLCYAIFSLTRQTFTIFKTSFRDWGKDSLLPNNRFVRWLYTKKNQVKIV
jgi:hypothetical protein